MKPKIYGSIITKNSETWLEAVLTTMSWMPKIFLVDNGSTDQTLQIAKKFKNVDIQKVQIDLPHSVAHQRNLSAAQVPDDAWIYFADSDELITQDLRQEILAAIQNSNDTAYMIPRLNVQLGHPLYHGGWYPDHQLRLIKKSALVEWVNGPLNLPPFITEDKFANLRKATYGPHDKPLLKKDTSVWYLKYPYIHFNHQSLDSMLQKTPRFLNSEALYLKDAGLLSRPSYLTFLAAPAKDFLIRFILKRGFRDGTVGLIESIYMAFSAFLFEVKKWELTQKPLPEVYAALKEKYVKDA